MFQAAGAWFSFQGEEEREKKWTTFFPNIHSKYSHQTYMLLKADNTRTTEPEESINQAKTDIVFRKEGSFKVQLAMILIRNLGVFSRLPCDSENKSSELLHSYCGFFATG